MPASKQRVSDDDDDAPGEPWPLRVEFDEVEITTDDLVYLIRVGARQKRSNERYNINGGYRRVTPN